MMKTIFILLLVILQFFGIVEPALAMSKQPVSFHPVYYQEFNYINENSCDAVMMIPYSGDVLYECPNGESFWSDVLVPTGNSPLFSYLKNRKKVSDETSESSLYY